MSKVTYCLDCNKICRSKYCQKCYLLNHNPAKNPDTAKKMAHHKELHPKWNGGKPKCLDCGSLLSRYDAKRCVKCARKGKLHPNWIDGRAIKPYPYEWNETLREKIRTRDNYSCQNTECTMTQEEHLIVFGSSIEVHHIDYNKQNCSENNLISVCKQCNIRANYNRDYWKFIYQKKVEEQIKSQK